jgi:SAM-dependent methyltransferase
MGLREVVRERLPVRWVRRVRHLKRWPRARWGNLRRRRPLSDNYGLDRGTPVDRMFIERFLAQHAHSISRRVLEVKNSDYTRAFGGDRVAVAEVLDIDATNPDATIVADLGEEGSLPRDRFDCIVLNQTLQLVPDYAAALRNCWGALAPGGTLLITVPTVSIVVEAINDLWRWTPAGFEIELGRHLPSGSFDVVGFGNLPSCLAFLHGVAAEELRPRYLDPPDPEYPLLVGAVVRKPPTATVVED